MNRWEESEKLDPETDRLHDILKKLAPLADMDFDHHIEKRLSPGDKMLFTFYIAVTDMANPDMIRMMHSVAQQWITKARSLYKRGLVPDPFGPERAFPERVTCFPLAPKYEKRGQVIRHILECRPR
jgi:hypothetical protein